MELTDEQQKAFEYCVAVYPKDVDSRVHLLVRVIPGVEHAKRNDIIGIYDLAHQMVKLERGIGR